MKKISILLLLFLLGSLTAAAPDEAGFIRDWLIAGPYPSYVVNGRDTGLESDPVGEKTVRPYPGLKDRAVFKADVAKLIAEEGGANEWGFRADHEVEVVWTPRHTDEFRLMVDGFFDPIEDHFVFYAACYIESPVDREVKFRIGSDDYHRLLVNGSAVGESATSQGVRKDGFIYKTRLRRGLNPVLLKVVDVINHCGFCLAVSDLDDKPLTDLKIHLDSPARKFGTDWYDNGYALKVDPVPSPLFAGEKQQLRLTLFAPQPGEYPLTLAGKSYRLRSGEPQTVPLQLKEGTHHLRCELENARFEPEVTVYSHAKLSERRQALKRQLAEAEAALAAARREQTRLTAARDAAEKELEAARAETEKRFAAERKAAIATAKPSVDRPLEPFANSRRRLCINGDWEFGAKRDRPDSHTHLPGIFCGNYFRHRYYPVQLTDPAKPHSAPVTAEPGHEYFEWNPLLTASRFYLSREVELDDPEAAHTFVSTHIAGRIRLWCNDELCGEYDGIFGLVEIPLRNVKAGRNRLTIEFNTTKYNHKFLRKRGLRGDLFIDSAPPVQVADVWVKTSYRKAALETVTELENRSAAPRRYELRQYAVEGDRICFELPPVSGELPAGSRRTAESRGLWSNPTLWELENPHLYTLVSDLYLDGKLADRSFDRFGFREVWLHGVDFYYNGRRIILQGDVGHADWTESKHCEVAWPLYRKDGINILRMHDSTAQNASGVPELADRLGMFIYAQYYPVIDHTEGKGNPPPQYSSVAEFLAGDNHRWNLGNLKRFHRMMRNHPSIIIWSTDNEIFTQSRDTAPRRALNARNDGIAAEYARALEAIDPGLVVTRDGDIGTWNSKQSYFEDPPRPVANYHYPDFSVSEWVMNWQTAFEFRPAIFGETLYCSYGAWNRWCGAVPEAVQGKARRVREIAGLYRKLGVPVQIYMGLGLDGFAELKPDGSGIPWGVIETPRAVPRPENWRRGVPESVYPWLKIDWPAYSGLGVRKPARNVDCRSYADRGINWSSAKHVSHIRNAVNDAYRDTLIPQPPLKEAADAECIIRTAPGVTVWATLPDGRRYGVVADSGGRAWMQLPAPGKYRFRAGKVEREFEVPARTSYAAQPGFDRVVTFEME